MSSGTLALVGTTTVSNNSSSSSSSTKASDSGMCTAREASASSLATQAFPAKDPGGDVVNNKAEKSSASKVNNLGSSSASKVGNKVSSGSNIVGRSSGSSTTANSKTIEGNSSSSSTAPLASEPDARVYKRMLARGFGPGMTNARSNNLIAIPGVPKKSPKFSSIFTRETKATARLFGPSEADPERLRVRMFTNASARAGKAGTLPVWPKVDDSLSYKDVFNDKKRYDKHWLATTLAKAMLPAIRKLKNLKKNPFQAGSRAQGNIGGGTSVGIRDKNLVKLIKSKASKTNLKEGQILVCRVDDRGNVSIVDPKSQKASNSTGRSLLNISNRGKGGIVGLSSEDDSRRGSGYDVGLLDDVNSVLDHQVESQQLSVTSSQSTNRLVRGSQQSRTDNLNIVDNINLILSKIGNSRHGSRSSASSVNNLVSLTSHGSSLHKVEKHEKFASRGTSKTGSIDERSYQTSQRSTLINRSSKPHVVIYRKNGRDIIVCIPREKTKGSLGSSLNNSTVNSTVTSVVNCRSKAMSTSSRGMSERIVSSKAFLPPNKSDAIPETHVHKETYQQDGVGNYENASWKSGPRSHSSDAFPGASVDGFGNASGITYYPQPWQMMQGTPAMQGSQVGIQGNIMQGTTIQGNAMHGNSMLQQNSVQGNPQNMHRNPQNRQGNPQNMQVNPQNMHGNPMQGNQFMQGMGIRLVPQGQSWIPVMEFCPPYVGFQQSIPTMGHSSQQSEPRKSVNSNSSNQQPNTFSNSGSDAFGQPIFLPFGTPSAQTTPRINGLTPSTPNFFPANVPTGGSCSSSANPNQPERRSSETYISPMSNGGLSTSNQCSANTAVPLCFPPVSAPQNAGSGTLMHAMPLPNVSIGMPTMGQEPLSHCSPGSSHTQQESGGSTSDSPENVLAFSNNSNNTMSGTNVKPSKKAPGFDINNLSDGGYDIGKDGDVTVQQEASCQKETRRLSTCEQDVPSGDAFDTNGLVDLSTLFPAGIFPTGLAANNFGDLFNPLGGGNMGGSFGVNKNNMPFSSNIGGGLNPFGDILGGLNTINESQTPLKNPGPPLMNPLTATPSFGNSSELQLGKQHFIGTMNGLGEITLFNNALQILNGGSQVQGSTSSIPGGGGSTNAGGTGNNGDTMNSGGTSNDGGGTTKLINSTSGNLNGPATPNRDSTNAEQKEQNNDQKVGGEQMVQVCINGQVFLMPASAIDGNVLRPMP